MNYIGVDCHISTLEFAVVNERGVSGLPPLTGPLEELESG